MIYTTTYKLEDFILNTKWEELPDEVKERIKGCLLDLTGALIVGSKSDQFKVGLRLAETLYGPGELPVPGTDKKFGFMGAAAAMGHSSNAYDIDDGHNLTRAHPGTSIIGAVLAAAMEKGIHKNEFLTALLVGYEVTIRSGAAIMEYYTNPHSSGTFGPAGIAAAVGRLYGWTKEEINNCISIAEFNAPLVAGGRSVAYPSMNKDGVPFGVMIGCLAIQEQLAGFTGNKNLLESDTYEHYIADIGEKWQVMDLYFKPYTCCRWAHPAIDACQAIMSEHGLTSEDIESVRIDTFQNACNLSKIVPQSADEAQYNIAYPVAAAVVYGDFGLAQVHESRIPDPKVVAMMDRLSFHPVEELTRQFPAHRICRAVITDKSGNTYVSADCEPRGEACENIRYEWLADKFRRITGPVLTQEGQEALIRMIGGDEDFAMIDFVNEINKKEYQKGFMV